MKKDYKGFKQRFEQAADDSDLSEEKKKQMQEELEIIKSKQICVFCKIGFSEEREEAQKRLAEERAREEEERQVEKEDLNIKATK